MIFSLPKILGAIFFLAIVSGAGCYAQLPDGSTAPDFTFTDINGNPQNLYNYLNQGRTVAIEVSATWCVPCWDYHSSRTMDSLYQKHDNPGDRTWTVLFIEGDANTTSADLQGTGTNTKGNWIQGTNYIMMDPAAGPALNSFRNDYSLSSFPTFMVICPNKKVYQSIVNGARPVLSTWEGVAVSSCNATGIDHTADNNPVTIFPNPAHGVTKLYFAVQSTADISLRITDPAGRTVDETNYGRLSAGDHALSYDAGRLAPGFYVFALSRNGIPVVRKKMLIL